MRTQIHFSSFSSFFSLLLLLRRTQACVRYYALDMVIMAAAYAIVRKVTKDPNAKFQPTNAKCPVVQHMDDALKANAIVNEAIKDTIAPNVSTRISHRSRRTHDRYTHVASNLRHMQCIRAAPTSGHGHWPRTIPYISTLLFISYGSDCDLSRGETFIDLFVISLQLFGFSEFPFHFYFSHISVLSLSFPVYSWLRGSILFGSRHLYQWTMLL